MIKSLSILLPSYNNVCLGFVTALCEQAAAIDRADFNYEIIVADDGSTDTAAIAANKAIDLLPHCRYITGWKNVGRAAIRNFLARQAKYDYLLFLDSDRNICRHDFINQYLSLDDTEVACGGLIPGGDAKKLNHNLRYRVEKRYEKHNTAASRQQREYANFNTSNFMTRRDIMLHIPFDERFRHYGYEDVMWGKQLKEHSIHITHIDNPILLDDYETNPCFVEKMETGMKTLSGFKDELKDFSAVISTYNRLKAIHLTRVFGSFFRLFRGVLKSNLVGDTPSPRLLNIYKLGVFTQCMSAKQ